MTKELKDKETLINKLRSRLKDVNSEYEKLKELFNRRETEYRELHIHHEDLTEFAQGLDQEKRNILIVNEKLKTENLQLSEDLRLLKNLVYRLNVEIERYQGRLRCASSQNETRFEPQVADDKVLESWGRVNIHALGPLLDAYQENIAEKDELIKKYGIEIEEFGGRCKDVINENETLQRELEDLSSKVVMSHRYK